MKAANKDDISNEEETQGERKSQQAMARVKTVTKVFRERVYRRKTCPPQKN